MWTHVPRADLQGQACRVPRHLSPPHSNPLPPSCGFGIGGRARSQLCHSTLFCVVFFSSPCISLFCSRQVIFRFSCIYCSCFLGMYVEGGFPLVFLLYHLEPAPLALCFFQLHEALPSPCAEALLCCLLYFHRYKFLTGASWFLESLYS